MSTISSDYTRGSLYSMYANSFTNLTQQTSLSDEQKSNIEELISNYDTSNLSADDATEIVTALKELGISPSQETDGYLEELGINAGELGQLAKDEEDNTLSDEQKSSIEEILSEYDVSNLSSDDANEIISAFQDLGINPSEEVDDYLDELGVNAGELGQLSQNSTQGSMPPPPPPPQTQEEISQILSELYEDIEDDESTTISTNPYASSDTSTSFSNLLDYTNRILSLNEDTRQDVLDMFENYNNSDDKSSQASTVRNELSSILANQNNYSSLSLYA